MADMVQKTIVGILALVFLFIGVAFIAAPGAMTDLATGAEPSKASSLTEIRAVSGGVALGIGLFFALCVRKTEWLTMALLLGALVGGSLALGRIIGFLADGDVTGTQASFAVLEVATLAVCSWALRRD
ncbi:DUF4345 domain-containing protein [Aeromicrobium terrae]|uniref:DUF4345 domain-containing protein n=1 Tax=Aeromicrobium terrae TaxID=2498846 RepID=A0A5C8NQE1_9ACTN|nr:DUF4345 domain-containing protein [Aeromicrobium terrae]TXL63091.1 DUF4345 domain-containing protein [Aeromicrobium terrae]